MGRPLRVDVGGYIYHALNRASARAILFEQPADGDGRSALSPGATISCAASRSARPCVLAAARSSKRVPRVFF